MTMTLEDLAARVRHRWPEEAATPDIMASLDAAIRERDELRHAAKVGVDAGRIADTYHSEYDHALARAEKAEAELAALRKRMVREDATD